METRTLQVNPEDTGTRLDAWLAGQLPDVTRSAAARLCEEGRVTAAGKPLAKNYRLSGGEAVSVTLPDPEPVDVAPQDIPLDVVYEDSDVIVVNKPKGLVVHPAPGHPDGTLVNALLHHCGDSLSGIGGELRPGIVHRIDRDTSGLLIAAKNDFAHQKLSAQLQDHTLARIYRCIVIGNLREDSGTVDAPIGRHPADRKKMAVVAGGRSAVTHWSVLERFPGYTYVECRLETGRTHQIRVHMAHIGHPILGDTVYGAKKPVPGLQGQCLHAVGLRFLHPRTGELVELWCDLPEAFQTQLRKLENRGENNAGPLSAVRRVCTRQPGVRRVLVRGAGDPQGAGLVLPPVLHAGMGAVAQAQGQKAPVGGVPGLPPVPPDVVPGKVATGAAVHVIPFLI